MSDKEVDVSRQLRRALKVDKKFERAIGNMDKLDANVDKWLDEIQSLHVRRGVRALDTGKMLESSQRVAIDTDIDEMALMSRVTEIKSRALRQILIIDENLDKLRKYVRFKYSDVLSAGKMAVTERKALIEDMISPATTAKKRLEGVMKMGDLILDDAKQASYGLSRINAILTARQKER